MGGWSSASRKVSHRTPSPKASSRWETARTRPSGRTWMSVGAELSPSASGPMTTKDGAPASMTPAGAEGMAHTAVPGPRAKTHAIAQTVCL